MVGELFEKHAEAWHGEVSERRQLKLNEPDHVRQMVHEVRRHGDEVDDDVEVVVVGGAGDEVLGHLEGPQKKQKKTSDASPGTTSDDEDFGCPNALDTKIRPEGNKRDKELLQKVRGSASDALAPKLSLEIVWTQKLEKVEVKEATKNARYERAFELQEKQIAMQERHTANEERERRKTDDNPGEGDGTETI
ncbi:glutathione S-transferase T2-like [Hordeum vulgare]|nr:glutathione S-transferase T2-like [Hordeum vulgare]